MFGGQAPLEHAQTVGDEAPSSLGSSPAASSTPWLSAFFHLNVMLDTYWFTFQPFRPVTLLPWIVKLSK